MAVISVIILKYSLSKMSKHDLIAAFLIIYDCYRYRADTQCFSPISETDSSMK